MPDDIRIAFAGISKAPSSGILNKSEQKEYENFKNIGRRREFLATRTLVKKVAAEQGFSIREFRIKKDDMGKPYAICNGQNIYLSIAHSNRNVMCSISTEREIGVDLEPIDREVNQRLGKRIYHPDETEETREIDLIRIWTIKEALIKLYGCGLRRNLKDLRVGRLTEEKFSGKFDNDNSAIICSFQRHQHWIAVAYYS